MATADYQPRWLVSLMCQWARRELAGQDGGLGYPKKAAFLLIHSNTPAKVDPTGESAQDFRELDEALELCRLNHLPLWAALMMYYKPWSIAGLRAEGFPFAPNQIYFTNLHKAHSCLETMLLNMRGQMAKPRPLESNYSLAQAS